MKTQFPGHHQNELKTVSLKPIIGQLVAQWQPMAVKQRSFILNDVPGDFHLKADGAALTIVVAALLKSIISRTANRCIHISVKRFNDIVILRLNDSNPLMHRCSQQDWQKMNLLAAKIGGCIIENDSNKKNSVALTFYGLSVAA